MSKEYYNSCNLGKEFTLKNKDMFWVLDERIESYGIRDRAHKIITLENLEYWPMKLIEICPMWDERRKDTSIYCKFAHNNRIVSYCYDQELVSLRPFMPSRLYIIDEL